MAQCIGHLIGRLRAAVNKQQRPSPSHAAATMSADDGIHVQRCAARRLSQRSFGTQHHEPPASAGDHRPFARESYASRCLIDASVQIGCSRETRAQSFIPAHHDIRALHRRAGSALHQVVDRAERHHATSRSHRARSRHRRSCCPTESSARDSDRNRSVLHDPHERLVGIRLAIRLPQILFLRARFTNTCAVASTPRTLSTAVALRCTSVTTSFSLQGLQHFGGVAMAGRREAAHHAGALGMMRRICRCRAALAAADLDLADDAARRVDQSGSRQRPDRQRRGGGIAADAADVVRGLQLRAMQLRQSVDELLQPRRAGVRLAIPRVVVARIAQPEVGAQIDDAIGQRDEADRCGSSRCRAAGRGTAGRTSRRPRCARTSAACVHAGWDA